MSAFFSKIGNWLLAQVWTYLVHVVRDQISAMIERRQQAKKDEQSKVPYEQAVNNATVSDQDLENATLNRLNGH